MLGENGAKLFQRINFHRLLRWWCSICCVCVCVWARNMHSHFPSLWYDFAHVRAHTHTTPNACTHDVVLINIEGGKAFFELCTTVPWGWWGEERCKHSTNNRRLDYVLWWSNLEFIATGQTVCQHVPPASRGSVAISGIKWGCFDLVLFLFYWRHLGTIVVILELSVIFW